MDAESSGRNKWVWEVVRLSLYVLGELFLLVLDSLI
jgi:hypothetical protein